MTLQVAEAYFTVQQLPAGDYSIAWAPRELAPFKPYLTRDGRYLSPLDPWRWLMRAWLVEDRAGDPPPPAEALMAERLLQRLQDLGLTRWAGQLTGALEVLRGVRVRRLGDRAVVEVDRVEGASGTAIREGRASVVTGRNSGADA